MCASACCLSTIISFIPLRELPESFADPNLRSEAIIALKACAVRIGDRHIARLHAYELAVAFEIVILGQDTCANEFFLQGRNVVQQVFGSAAADVVDSVGRQRETVFAGLLLRCSLHDADDAFDNVVDIGEVALAVAVVENLDGLACLQFLCGGEVEHVRAACRAVNGKEAEPGGRNIVELAVAVCQELVGFFSGRVEGDRVVDFVFHCEGHFFVAAVDRGAGGVDKVLDACAVIVGVAAGFEDVVETDQVALYVDVRVIDGVADAGLRRKVYDDVRLVGVESGVEQCFVSDAASDKDMPDW